MKAYRCDCCGKYINEDQQRYNFKLQPATMMSLVIDISSEDLCYECGKAVDAFLNLRKIQAQT